jgi:prepilin-type N-terminal cleavage/methylation domain-containing protein
MERFRVETLSMKARSAEEAGFTLIEVMIAMILLTIGALALAGGVALGARRLTGSQEQLMASERASEAAESVFKARDNRILTWAQIRNIGGATGTDGGIFLDGSQPVKTPGLDGLVNTIDDGALEEIIKPGTDGLLGTADDVHVPLFGFTREIEIRDLGPSLRQLRVIVRYRASNGGTTQYVLTTYLSAYA